jgi:hypothetical protein
MREGDYLQDLGVDGRIRLRWTFEKWNEGHGLIDLVQDREFAGSCVFGNEPSGSI